MWRCRSRSFPSLYAACTLLACALAGLSGCGTTQARVATDQMLASDAVDHAVSHLDFSPLSGQKVFFDEKFLQQPPGIIVGVGVVNQIYVASALRQHLLASGVLLADKLENSDIVMEARVGILGSDRHDLTYGLPASAANNLAATAATAATQVPIVIPEVSLARRVDQTAAAKIACYAYARDTRERVWQSGTSLARSTSKDSWLFGAGPFQKTTVENGVQFAGTSFSPFGKGPKKQRIDASFDESVVFKEGHKVKPPEEAKPAPPAIQQAAAEVKAPDPKAAGDKPSDSKSADSKASASPGTAPKELEKVAEAPQLLPAGDSEAPRPFPGAPSAAVGPAAGSPADSPQKTEAAPEAADDQPRPAPASASTEPAPVAPSSFPWAPR